MGTVTSLSRWLAEHIPCKALLCRVRLANILLTLPLDSEPRSRLAESDKAFQLEIPPPTLLVCIARAPANRNLSRELSGCSSPHPENLLLNMRVRQLYHNCLP
jgi:hypothetical protein